MKRCLASVSILLAPMPSGNKGHMGNVPSSGRREETSNQIDGHTRITKYKPKEIDWWSAFLEKAIRKRNQLTKLLQLIPSRKPSTTSASISALMAALERPILEGSRCMQVDQIAHWVTLVR